MILLAVFLVCMCFGLGLTVCGVAGAFDNNLWLNDVAFSVMNVVYGIGVVAFLLWLIVK